MFRFSKLSFLSALLLLLCNVAQAQPTSAFEGEPFHATADQLRTAASANPAIAGAEATVLYQEFIYRFAADRTLHYRYRMIYRIDSQEGVNNWAESSMRWDPWYEKQAQIHVRVLMPGGQFSELDQKTITDTPRNSDEPDTYTTGRIRKAPIPALVVGSIVEEESTVEEKRPFSMSGNTYRINFLLKEPTAFKKVMVEIPSSMPYKEKVHFLPDLHVTKTEKDGVRTMTYVAVNLPARVASDIDLASDVVRSPAVEFSTGTSWKETEEEYAKLSDPSLQEDPDAKATLASLLPPKGTSRKATIAALLQHLHKLVRYTGVEFDEAQMVPTKPSETLKRHYGDCKDKAALLVAMLRAANIPASLALLETGPGRDIAEDMPGLNQFDHAIVYVPAANGEPAFWIDATATYFSLGSIPYADAGRLALIIAPGTAALKKIPEATPEDSVLVETRDFRLPEYGYSTVEETSETHGYVDASYRSLYSSISDEMKKKLEEYVHNAYIAKELKKIDHGNGENLNEPFSLKLVATEARRGESSLIDAAVAIFPYGLANQLPNWFSQKPEEDNGTPEQKKRQDEAIANRPESFQIRPFVIEQRIRVHIPNGFIARTLPSDKVTKMGPGSLTETYRLEDPTLLSATLRFTTGTSRLTKAEALEMRDAVLQLNKRGILILGLDESGTKLIADGKEREALDAEKKAIEVSPKSAIAHVHYAYALLKVGIQEKAKEEALLATQIEPSSAVAYACLGWVLEHNSLGIRFGLGFDHDGAVTAYRKAVALDPERENYSFDLAILEEFDKNGTRYADAAGVKDAIRDYRTLIEKNPNSSGLAQYQDNLLYALLLTQRFGEVDSMLAKLPMNANRNAISIVSMTAQHGVSKGLAEADRNSNSTQERSAALKNAGELLARLQLYAEAAEILKSGMDGQSNVPAIARQVELFHSLKKMPTALPSGADPTDPIRASIVSALTNEVSEELIASFSSRNAYLSDSEWQRSVKEAMKSRGLLRRISASGGMDESVLRDLILGNMKLTTKGDDKVGYEVIMQSLGSEPDSFYTMKEDNRYRSIASKKDDYETGAYTLYLLNNKREDAARAILNWKRDQVKRNNSDDALDGPLLPRFWKPATSQSDATPEAMKVAAIALISHSSDVQPYLSFVEQVRASLSSSTPHAEQKRTDLSLLLATGYISSRQPDKAIAQVEELLKEEPDSLHAIRLAGNAYSISKNYSAWNSLLTAKLAAKPADHDLLYQQSGLLSAEGKYKEAQDIMQKILDGGHATETDYNGFAWLGLFADNLGTQTTEAAHQAVMIGKSEKFGSLHTLASVYAKQGRVKEAREVLLQGMNAADLSEANSACWYVIGVLDRQLGIEDAALKAFQRVDSKEYDGKSIIDPTSTWWLAERELHAHTTSTPEPKASKK